MITEEEAYAAVMTLSVLPYFPAGQAAHMVVADLIMRMCNTGEQAQWLVRRAMDLWSKWEGPRELRGLMCSRFKPKDGIEVNYSALFPDGIPSEKPLPPPAMPALPPGRVVSADHILDDLVQSVAKLKGPESLPPPSREAEKDARAFQKLLEDIEDGQDRIDPPKRKPPRQSEVIRLSNDPAHESRPEGSYQQITQADVDAAVAELRRKKEQNADTSARKDDDN
jgi:hypothetical protein